MRSFRVLPETVVFFEVAGRMTPRLLSMPRIIRRNRLFSSNFVCRLSGVCSSSACSSCSLVVFSATFFSAILHLQYPSSTPEVYAFKSLSMSSDGPEIKNPASLVGITQSRLKPIGSCSPASRTQSSRPSGTNVYLQCRHRVVDHQPCHRVTVCKQAVVCHVTCWPDR